MDINETLPQPAAAQVPTPVPSSEKSKSYENAETDAEDALDLVSVHSILFIIVFRFIAAPQ